MTESRDRILEQLADRLASAGPPGPASPCPDANLLAALSEGALEEEERASLLEHLAACASCRALLVELDEDAGLLEATPPEPGQRAPRTLRLPGWLLAAAIVLVCVVLAIRSVLVSGGARTGEPLLVAAGELADRRPELFDGFRPLESEELSALRQTILRSPGIVLLEPAGTILDGRPLLRWEPLAGAGVYRIRVTSAAGEELLQATSTSPTLPWPEDAPALRPGARYLWEVEGEGLFGTEQGLGAFELPDQAEGVRLREALAVIREEAPPELRHLLTAHYALRAGLLGEAERSLRALLRELPDHREGRALLEAVLRALGAEEAGTLAPDGPGSGG